MKYNQQQVPKLQDENIRNEACINHLQHVIRTFPPILISDKQTAFWACPPELSLNACVEPVIQRPSNTKSGYKTVPYYTRLSGLKVRLGGGSIPTIPIPDLLHEKILVVRLLKPTKTFIIDFA